jgi:hypothetical protein
MMHTLLCIEYLYFFYCYSLQGTWYLVEQRLAYFLIFAYQSVITSYSSLQLRLEIIGLDLGRYI